MKKLWFICTKNINNSRNVLFVIVFSIIFLIMIVSVTFITFIKDYYNNTLEKYISARTLYVSKNDDFDIEIPEISKIEHVTFVTEWKFNGSVSGEIPQLSNENIETEVELIALLDKNEIKIGDGRLIENDGEAICPSKFYPYAPFIKNGDTYVNKIYPNKIINGKNVIGQEIIIDSKNPEHKDVKVKIVGTYDSYFNMNELNDCYITKNDLAKVLPLYAGTTEIEHTDGTTEVTYHKHSGLLVRVDNYINVERVINELNKLGYGAQETFYFDTQLLGYLYYIPLIILLITFVLSFGILYNYIKKRIIYRLKEYAIYLSVGYSKEYVKRINIMESIILILISSCMALIIYFIFYNILIYGLLSEFMYSSIKIKIPYLYILLLLLEVITLILILTDYLLKRRLNDDLYKILNETENYNS